MNYFLSQIILAARNRDAEGTGWMRILIFVVMGVLWALGSIAKARANKADQQDQERQPGVKPPKGIRTAPKTLPKTPYQQTQRSLAHRQHRPQIRPPHREVMRPQPAARKFTTKTEQAVRLQGIKPPESPELSPPTPQFQPGLEKFPEFTGESVKKLGDERIAIAAETAQAKYLAEILLDYADPDDLRRAILHYEILGKPLSLRPSSGPIIRL